jgi:hypothetical protein
MGSRCSKTELYHDDILMKHKTPKLSEKAINDDDDDDDDDDDNDNCMGWHSRNTLDSYFGVAQFESWPGVRFTVVFLRPTIRPQPVPSKSSFIYHPTIQCHID